MLQAEILSVSGRAQENMYFSQEDERLLKKLLENNPDLEAKFASGDAAACGENVEEKIKMVFLKHGIPPLNKKLIADLAAVLGKE